MGLSEFVMACKAVDSRLELRDIGGGVCAVIGDRHVAIGGYNLPYQAFLITALMKECGDFV